MARGLRAARMVYNVNGSGTGSDLPEQARVDAKRGARCYLRGDRVSLRRRTNAGLSGRFGAGRVERGVTFRFPARTARKITKITPSPGIQAANVVFDCLG